MASKPTSSYSFVAKPYSIESVIHLVLGVHRRPLCGTSTVGWNASAERPTHAAAGWGGGGHGGKYVYLRIVGRGEAVGARG